MMNYSTYWSWLSFFFYLILGTIGALCCYAEKRESLRTNKKKRWYDFPYLCWIITWTFFGAFRLVNSSVGGYDAPDYIQYFKNCLAITTDNTDLIFKYFTRIIRMMTSDYHLYFIIYYFIIVLSIVLFVKEFATDYSSTVPIIIAIYLYLRSFTSMRSNLAIAFTLIAIVFLNRREYKKVFIFSMFAILTHVSALIYVGFILFYYIYRDRKIGLLKSIVFFALAFFVGIFLQRIMANGGLSILDTISTGAYASYAQRSRSRSFIFQNISNLPQMFLFVILMIFRKPLDKAMGLKDESMNRRFQILKLMCIYDFIMVPIIFVLSVYRGYEYFYSARLVMWGELMPLIESYFTRESRKIIHVLFVIFFVVWMYGRIEATWESSHLMPYIFSLWG